MDLDVAIRGNMATFQLAPRRPRNSHVDPVIATPWDPVTAPR